MILSTGEVSLKAVVLAGGKGTRMREITNSIPKPLVEVGGRPVLHHILTSLAGAGVREAVMRWTRAHGTPTEGRRDNENRCHKPRERAVQ